MRVADLGAGRADVCHAPVVLMDANGPLLPFVTSQVAAAHLK